ncbi:HAD family hydrolase [Paenibacillus mendelii]|uniref:HAD family hydrolase n=1 Tax=Paenibacillus mendelii TaxID=206163 RepID=A0ABV6JKB1_9BACL|nr:HAD family hydrolase [Paenibacillus mendelii]MCQ6559182.1 HAD family hydrolase [Paenibacillus mendelii]
MIKGVIFDFDGLIIDTESAWFEAIGEIYNEHGAYLPLETWTKCVGTSHDAFDPYLHLAEIADRPVNIEEIKKTALVKHDYLMQRRVLRPGVLDYLNEAQQLGLRIGIASSSHLAWVQRFVDLFDIAGYFSCIRTADFVQKVKPDPELYLQALAALELKPEEAVCFEDSPNGAKAAHAAGLNVVIVPNAITEGLTFGPHKLRMNSMEERSLAEVIAFVTSK